MQQSSPVIEIFDPPMCCPGGLCGPVIDPALLDVNEVILRLRKEHGVVVHRYLLQQQGQKFMQNPHVLARLKERSTAALPITVVDGEPVKDGAFPTYEELVRYCGQPVEAV